MEDIMRHSGSQFYDQENVFQNYQQRRSWNENANDTIEKPIMMDLIDNVAQRNILDLGCGNASFGNDLLDLGANSYTGIEGSANMFEMSKKTMNRPSGQVIHTTIEEWDYPESHFHLVVSRLAIHYLADIDSLFHKVHKSLANEGTFVFSVEHPVITSSYAQPEGSKQTWLVDNYFHTGKREQYWLGATVLKYHRTIEDYFSSLQSAGFHIASLRESKPRPENFETIETYKRRMRIPLFLFIKAKKI
jgi:SAM-dependent methyltransferase